MREIKVRVWDKKEKEMSPGMPLTMLAGFIYGKYQTTSRGLGNELYLEWTGLTDMDGVEIYEGDVIDFAGLKPIEIKWIASRFKGEMMGMGGVEPIRLDLPEAIKMFAKVLGNVYENPELL